VLKLIILRYTNLEIINILRREGAFSNPSIDISNLYRALIRLNIRDIRNL
jgi:hypothetical protein